MRLLWCLSVILPLSAQSQQPFDILITGARLVDGSGNPFYYADIAIRGDSIVAIGALKGRPASVVVDASGLTITPGFIDLHSHAGRSLKQVPAVENNIRQGVTTLIDGPDGGTAVPLKPQLDTWAGMRLASNVGSYIGHGSIRNAVMASERRKPTPQELDRMRELARQGMRDGAFGLSTGLFYVPGNYAETEEVIEIAKEIGKLGGYHISHMRDEASRVVDSVRETIRVGEEGGLPTQVTHHKIMGKANWGVSESTLRLVEEARVRGVDVTIDQYPYTASSTSVRAALFPQWAMAGGNPAFKERMAAPDQRRKIKLEVMEKIEKERGGGDPKNVVFASCDFDASLAGKSLADATAARGVPVTIENAAETAIDIVMKGNCSGVFHAISEPDIERILRSPFTMVASDGDAPVFGRNVPHPRSYGAFARVLARYVRDKKIVRFEEAVWKMSGFPAQRAKLFDRGILRPGMKADLVVVDPATVLDKADFLNPHQYAEGVRDVLVNGKFVLRNGKMTGERSGRVLFGPAYTGIR